MENKDAKEISEAIARLSQQNADYKAIEAVRANHRKTTSWLSKSINTMALILIAMIVGFSITDSHAIEVPHNRVIERQVIKSNQGENIIIEIIAKDEARRALEAK